MPRIRYLAPLLVVFLLGANGESNGCSCKKQPDVEPVDTDVEEPQPVAVELQVTSIEPSSHGAGEPFAATIYGAGFQEGARVHLRDLQAEDVRLEDENTLSLSVPALDEGVYDVVVTNQDGTRATLRRGLEIVQDIPDCSFLRVHFEFDEAGLTEQGKAALDELMPCYTELGSPIRIEGHADARGTVDYNLALGQRRADTVERYLGAQGVATSRMETISYGEERPASEGDDEAAWAENRRVDIHVGG